MGHKLFALLMLSLTACGQGFPESESPSDLELSSNEEELITDSWQGLYAVRPSGTSGYLYHPISAVTLTCLDGTIQNECPAGRLDFGPSGLDVQRQQETLAHLQNEPADEASIAVVVKAQPTLVRDHRNNTTYQSLRISAVYRAPSVRLHAAIFVYVVTPADSGGFQTTHRINSDFSGRIRIVDVAYEGKYSWVGPSSQAPNYFPVDNLFTVKAFRPTGNNGPLVTRYEFDVDQRFKRITNTP